MQIEYDCIMYMLKDGAIGYKMCLSCFMLIRWKNSILLPHMNHIILKFSWVFCLKASLYEIWKLQRIPEQNDIVLN